MEQIEPRTQHHRLRTGSVRAAADRAVSDAGWKSLITWMPITSISIRSDRFSSCQRFLHHRCGGLDAKPADPEYLAAFVKRHPELLGELPIPGIAQAPRIDQAFLERTAAKYLAAVKEAGRIYRKIEERKGKGKFIPEVSMDETDSPQTPAELLIILVAIADEGIPIQTIAPKFTGRFNKGRRLSR